MEEDFVSTLVNAPLERGYARNSRIIIGIIEGVSGLGVALEQIKYRLLARPDTEIREPGQVRCCLDVIDEVVRSTSYSLGSTR